MTVTREQVAHLRDGDHVTVKFTGYGNIEDPVTSVLREHYGELRLAGGYTVRMKDGSPSPELAAVVRVNDPADAVPPEPEPVREPGWYQASDKLGAAITLALWDKGQWWATDGQLVKTPAAWLAKFGTERVADLDGNPVSEPCSKRHLNASEIVIDLGAVDSGVIYSLHEAFSAEVEYRDDQIRAAM